MKYFHIMDFPFCILISILYSRLRPDQRALEEGRVAEAENIKLGVEQSQRDRRRQTENLQVGKMYVLELLVIYISL